MVGQTRREFLRAAGVATLGGAGLGRRDLSEARQYIFCERVRGNPQGRREVLAGTKGRVYGSGERLEIRSVRERAGIYVRSVAGYG